MTASLSSAIAHVNQKVADVCARVHRDRDEVTMIAVTKTVPADMVNAAIDHGIRAIGENRVQEARDKFPHIQKPVDRHYIGPLQRNKAGVAVELFDWIHSIDSVRLAKAVGRRAQAADKTMNVLIQVNATGEAQKHGVHPDQLEDVVTAVAGVSGLHVRGLMAMGPHTTDRKDIERVFRHVGSLWQTLRSKGIPGVSMDHLSMGMSGDYDLAVEAGATMIRVGSVLFGQ